jgi:hypothetical protein
MSKTNKQDKSKTTDAIDQLKKVMDLPISQYGYPMVTICSDLNHHAITIELDVPRGQGLINNMKIDYAYPVDLTMLLKKIVGNLKAEYNIKSIVQHVSRDDWVNILIHQNIFNLVLDNQQPGVCTVICDIDKFPEAVMKAMGFEEFDKNQTK